MAKRSIRAADELQQRHTWLAVPVAVWKKFGDDQAGNLAALIAYRRDHLAGPAVRRRLFRGASAGPHLLGVRHLRRGARLIAWLYLEAELTLYAVEINVVVTHRLWPRSIAPPPYTEQDRRAFELYAQSQKRSKDDGEKTSG